MGTYDEIYSRSLEDPSGFWGEAAGSIDWYVEPTVVLDDSNPPFYRWYSDGVLNTCHNALDRHVDGHRHQQREQIDVTIGKGLALAEIHPSDGQIVPILCSGLQRLSKSLKRRVRRGLVLRHLLGRQDSSEGGRQLVGPDP